MSNSTSTSTSDDDGDADDATSTTVTADNGAVTITKHAGHDGQAITTVAKDDDFPRYDHHGWHGNSTFLAMIALILVAGLIRTWIRARHGDTRTNRQRKRDERTGLIGPNLTATRENELLAQENERLKAQAIRLEDRVAVLERIVTDPAKRVADEIDALR